jgi:AcrR family transcriptional regulator/transposase-like protein
MARTGRPTATVVLSETERAELLRGARAATSTRAHASRCEIVLAAADGVTNTEIAQRLGISMPTVGKWRTRFLEHRLAGLADEARPGRPPSIPLERVEQVLTATLESTPPNATHWSRASMAARSGVSKSTIGRIWRRFDLKPDIQDGCTISTDPPNPQVEADPRPRRRKTLITVEQVIDTALGVIAAEGYEALTMRRLAGALDTGPASLYAHVVNKADLDGLLIGRLCAALVLPEPDPAAWRRQIRGVCAQIRDQYLRYPGISRAALAMVPTDLKTVRVSEGMLAILLAGGVAPRAAVWAIDALLLYVAAYCLEASIVRQRSAHDDAGWVLDRDELLRRFTALPAETFPHTTRHAAELTAGEGHDRFDFTLALMIDGLAHR